MVRSGNWEPPKGRKPRKSATEYNRERFERMVDAGCDPNAVLCPRCGMAFLVPGTRACDRYGVCPTCLERACKLAVEEEARLLMAKTEHATARKVLERARAKTGSGARARRKPKFD